MWPTGYVAGTSTGKENLKTDTERATMNIFTWSDFHPEVAEIFKGAYPLYKKVWIDWPCEKIDTGLTPVGQPSIAKGPGQELFVAGRKGQVFHSVDLGKTWALLSTSPAFAPDLSKGMKMLRYGSRGIGATDKGTILVVWGASYSTKGGQPSDETFHRFAGVTRSEDRGRTWESATPFDPAPYQNAGDQATILALRDGRLMVPIRVRPGSRSGKPVSLSENIFRSFIYTSSDDGKTWPKFSRFTDHSPEPHLLELPSGKILAAVRYQRYKLPDEPQELATPFLPSDWDEGLTSPTDIGQTLFQNTAFTISEDGGRTWATPRLITGTLQQTGSLVGLSDGTLVLIFGRWGQRFMLSYDDGKTWSKAVYQLNATGEYARSVVLEDDTIITVHDNVGSDGSDEVWSGRGTLIVLRWKAPPRKEVEKHGFFTPRDVEAPLGFSIKK